MGSSTSSQGITHKAPRVCQYCTVILPKCDTNKGSVKLEMICPRCHGENNIARISHNNNKKSSFSSPKYKSNNKQNNLLNNNNNNNNNGSINGSNISNKNEIMIRQSRRYLEHVYVAPFKNSVDNIEEKEISSQYLIDQYLKPYFNENRQIIIKSGNRLIIRGIEFKIYGCYPPKGILILYI